MFNKYYDLRKDINGMVIINNWIDKKPSICN